jgi:Cu-processing system ATP-binding protein
MISFRAFGKTYGRHQAVASLSLDLEAGEAVALLGPNGSGKTTCLKAAAGLIAPTSGEVLVGAPPRRAADPAARRTLSYLPQRVSFPEALSGREVVEFYRGLRGLDRARTEAALKFASLNGAGARAVGTYSGGMVQRLGLAVAILPEAPLMLLDEPTAALDPDGLCAFYGMVERRKRQGQTILFTSHQLGDAERLADRFAILVEGQLVALLGARELTARLSDRGVMRLRLDRHPPDLLAALHVVAPRAIWAGDELIVPGPTAVRPPVLDRIRAAGVGITALGVEEGRLDLLYRELVAGTDAADEAAPASEAAASAGAVASGGSK